MNPKDLILLCVSIVNAGALAGGACPDDSEAYAISFVSSAAQAIQQESDKLDRADAGREN